MTSGIIRRERFDCSADFFAHQGSAWMKLSREAAIAIVGECSSQGKAVSIIEGGIWHESGFEARIDAIWHSQFDQRPDVDDMIENNSVAEAYLTNVMPAECDTAIISVFKD